MLQSVTLSIEPRTIPRQIKAVIINIDSSTVVSATTTTFFLCAKGLSPGCHVLSPKPMTRDGPSTTYSCVSIEYLQHAAVGYPACRSIQTKTNIKQMQDLHHPKKSCSSSMSTIQTASNLRRSVALQPFQRQPHLSYPCLSSLPGLLRLPKRAKPMIAFVVDQGLSHWPFGAVDSKSQSNPLKNYSSTKRASENAPTIYQSI